MENVIKIERSERKPDRTPGKLKTILERRKWSRFTVTTDIASRIAIILRGIGVSVLSSDKTVAVLKPSEWTPEMSITTFSALITALVEDKSSSITFRSDKNADTEARQHKMSTA